MNNILSHTPTPQQITKICIDLHHGHLAIIYSLFSVFLFAMMLFCIIHRGRYDRIENSIKDISKNVQELLDRDPKIYLKM